MKNIVITGSTRGIGLGLAREFLKRGCNVTISGRSAGSVDHALAQLSEYADHIHGVPCVITEHEQVQALWDQAKQHWGSVDVWISNAGVVNDETDKLMHEQSPETLRKVIEINLIGSMYCSQVVVHGMLEQGGGYYYNFEGFGSNGKLFQPGMAPYGASKCGLRYLTNALVREMKGTPVKVGALSPGIVITDLLMGQYEGRPEDLAKSKKIYNILGDRVETVTPFLVEKVLDNTKHGALIEWLTTRKAMGRFMTAGFRKRDLFSAGDSVAPAATAEAPPRLMSNPPPEDGGDQP